MTAAEIECKKGNYKFTVHEQLKIAHLGSMRIWNLKHKLIAKQKARKKKNKVEYIYQSKLL